jgi:signal transduction histidine kinase
MEDGVLVTNREGKLVYYNPALLRLLQIRDQRPEVGAPPSSAMFPADLLSSMDEALAQDETIRVARELSGGPPHLSANVAVIRDERADSIGTVAVLRDVTEAKKLEQQMGAFVSMVAHELRAPLGVIARYLDLVLEGVITDNPAKLEQVLGRCRNRTGALAQLVKDLLEFSRLRHEKTRDRTFTPVDLAEIMRETVDFASLSAASRKITIAADIPDDLPKVAADRDEILRLFTNLVDNGIKYNRDEGALRIGTSLRGGYVCMEVVDTGLGIPKDHLNRLGEAFYRVKTPETASITGTGLGVSICKQIVEAHDGQLEIESEEGKGSTFRVLLPAMGATA